MANSGMEHAIVRSTHAYGLGGAWLAATVEGATASPPFVIGDGRQSVAPVFADDVAAVLAAADDREGRLEGTWAIEGPDAVAMADLVGTPRGSRSRTARSAGPARRRGAARRARRAHLPTAAELFALPSRADAPDAAAAFGVSRTTLVDGLRATAQQTAGVER